MTKYHKIQSIFKRGERGKFTDEYSIPEIEYLKDNRWYWTEKVDGTNIRIMWDAIEQKLRFGGKTDNAQIPVKLYNKLVEIFPKEKFIGLGSMCLYGEGFGVGIQSGGNYIKDGVDFVLFDVKVDDWWLRRESVEEIARNLDIGIVPIVGIGTISEAIEYVKRGVKSCWGSFEAEGLVLKTDPELFARNGDRIITKIKHKDLKI